MTFYVTDQNVVVLVLLVFGAVVGVFRDVVLVKRKFVHTGKILVFLEDFLGCIFFTVVYQITVFVTNYGYIRWYELASVFAGFFLYRSLLSQLLVKIMCLLGEILRRIIRITLSPVMLLLGLLRKAETRLCTVLSKKKRRIYSDMLRKRYLEKAKRGF